MNWLCVQIGRREHYAIPRALRGNGQNVQLVTDFWRGAMQPAALAGFLPGALQDRWVNADVGKVSAFNTSCLVHEITSRLHGGGIFKRALRRNAWFESRLRHLLASQADEPDIVFSYSYAATEAIHYAKAHGRPIILGQIDGGLYEEQLLERQTASGGKRAPAWYWENWKEEVAAADAVVVNSEWAGECLARTGCRPKRVDVIPLAYSPMEGAPVSRDMPDTFSPERPLRVLFLGQIIARKGMAQLLGAVQRAADHELPVMFHFVGTGEPKFIDLIGRLPNARHHGHVTSVQAAEFYRAADVFVLPTLSDGFALTQLEAQSHQLPVIASRHCGRIVEHGHNGILLDEISSDAIYAAVAGLCRSPNEVARLQHASEVGQQFSLASVGQRYVALAEKVLSGR